MREYELEARCQKSFYKKAYVKEDDNGSATLYSYGTPVATITGGEFVRLWAGWSSTTAKHVNDFRRERRMNPIYKKEWEALPVKDFQIGDKVDAYRNGVTYRVNMFY